MQPNGSHFTFGVRRTAQKEELQQLKGTSRTNSRQCIPSWTAKRIHSRMIKERLKTNSASGGGEQGGTNKSNIKQGLQSSVSKNRLGSAVPNTTSEGFVKPIAAPLLSVRSRCAGAAGVGTLKKSQSYQNLKCSNDRSDFSGKHAGPVSNQVISHSKAPNPSAERVSETNKNHYGSVTCLSDASSRMLDDGLASSESQFPFLLSAYDGQHSPCNAHRISVNSDLLSRVEKEKKQYEARISELTQVTETRKMEIEKLTFEVRRAKEEALTASSLAEEAMKEIEALRLQLSKLDNQSYNPSKEECNETPVSPIDVLLSRRLEPKVIAPPHSPSESLSTTTRLTPGVATTVLTTGNVTVSSVCSDLNELGGPSLNACTNASILSGQLPYVALSDTFPTSELLKSNLMPSDHIKSDFSEKIPEDDTLTSLKGRILQMEEANCTTNEELQATLQELWDLQKNVDEAHEETHSLAYEKDILLEALSTQTTKLEHCRFQIEQLKYLLLTDRSAQTPGTRENHFHTLYSSIEQEKQVLLGQNNDLAQSSESLARECRVLTEKAAQLQDNFDALETEHASLKSAYQSISVELNALKSRAELDDSESRMNNDAMVDMKLKDQTDFAEVVEATTSSHYTPGLQQDNPDILQHQNLTELSQKLKDLQECFDTLQSEYSRECAEWRLYERDLLKAVHVAETFRSEWETKTSKLEMENHSLKNQINSLKEASSLLNNEIATLKAKAVAVTTPNPVVGISNDTVAGAATVITPPTSPSHHSTGHFGEDVKAHSTASSIASTSTAVANSSEVTACKASNTSVVSVLNPVAYTAHPRCSTGFGHLHHHHHSSSYSSSPGAPGRSFGPTVRSLIQSIENQVKAVQHQQRGITSKQTPGNNQLSRTSSGSSTSSPLRNVFRTSSTVTPTAASVEPSSYPVPTAFSHQQQSTPTSASAVSPSLANTPGRTKPRSARFTVTGETGASRLATATGVAPGEDNTSAPGGPRSLKQPGDSHPKIVREAMDADGSCNAEDAKNTSRTNLLFRSTSINTQRDGTTTSGDLIPPLHASLELSSHRRTSSPARTGPDPIGLVHRLGGTPPAAGGKNSRTPAAHRSNMVAGAPLTCSPAQPPAQSTGVSTTSIDLGREDEPVTTSSVGSTSIHHFWQDPLQELARRTQAGSKRNALLRWCQSRVVDYPGVEVNNFSSSWNSGLALCALLHTYRPEKIPWSDLITANGQPVDRRRCFEVAFSVAEKDGVPTTLHLQDMLTVDRPDWNTVMGYVTSIYRRYETTATVEAGAPAAQTVTSCSG